MEPELSDIFTMLSMMLPGTVGVYYGQEIAMVNGFIIEKQMQDFSGRGSRDPSRLAMQWDDSVNAGKAPNRLHNISILMMNLHYAATSIQVPLIFSLIFQVILS